MSELDVSSWDVSKVKNMMQTFQWMSSITTLDVSNWDVSNVGNFDWTFADMDNLVKLDVSKWSTPSAFSMMGTFQNNVNLEKLNLNAWDISNVYDVSDIFKETIRLQELVLGPKSIFNMGDTGLPMIDTSTHIYTGSWERINTPDNPVVYSDSTTFMENYDDNLTGTYIWQIYPTVTVKDSTLYVGDNWQAVDNFVSATDGTGSNVSFTSIIFTGSVDTTKPSKYAVTYINGTASNIAIITVIGKSDITIDSDVTTHSIIADSTVTLPVTGEQTTFVFMVICLLVISGLILCSTQLLKDRKKVKSNKFEN